MIRTTIIPAIAALFLLVLIGQDATAQQPRRLGGYVPQYRPAKPTLSPYLDYYRPRQGELDNYNQFVRPRQAARRRLAEFEQDYRNVRGSLSNLGTAFDQQQRDFNAFRAAAVGATGKGARFEEVGGRFGRYPNFAR